MSKKLPEPGEVVRLASTSPFVPAGLYRYEGKESGMLHLSAGEISLGTQIGSVRVIARRLPEPYSWLPHEVAVLRSLLEICDCAECRANLKKKEAELSQLGVDDNAAGVILQ